MNEENGLRGGNKYAEVAKKNKENHIFALESDSGGFTPRGFSFDASDSQFEKIQSWKPLFEPYLIHYFERGGSGADVGPLRMAIRYWPVYDPILNDILIITMRLQILLTI